MTVSPEDFINICDLCYRYATGVDSGIGRCTGRSSPIAWSSISPASTAGPRRKSLPMTG